MMKGSGRWSMESSYDGTFGRLGVEIYIDRSYEY